MSIDSVRKGNLCTSRFESNKGYLITAGISRIGVEKIKTGVLLIDMNQT